MNLVALNEIALDLVSVGSIDYFEVDMLTMDRAVIG